MVKDERFALILSNKLNKKSVISKLIITLFYSLINYLFKMLSMFAFDFFNVLYKVSEIK